MPKTLIRVKSFDDIWHEIRAAARSSPRQALGGSSVMGAEGLLHVKLGVVYGQYLHERWAYCGNSLGQCLIKVIGRRDAP